MTSPSDLARYSAYTRGIERHEATDRAAWLMLRRLDVTASAAGALLGIHEYVTPFALWHDKRGSGPAAEPDEPEIDADQITLSPLARGTMLEPVALDLLARLRPLWRVEPARHYFRDPVARIGATPDAFAIDPDRAGFGVIQIKSVGEWAARKWRDADTGDMEPPLWIAVQAIVEATLTGASWAAVAALRTGGALSLRLIDIPLHERTIARLREEIAAFWRRVETGEEYPPDYGRDAALIARLHADDDGSEIDLSGDERVAEIVALRAALTVRESDGRTAKKARAPLDAELTHRIGNASKARLPHGLILTCTTVRRREHTVKASQHTKIAIKPARKEAAE